MTSWDELKFKPEDFGLDEYYNAKDSYPQLNTWTASEIANRILKEKLENAQLVHTVFPVEGEEDDPRWWYDRQIELKDGFTHRARLVCIEELKKD